MKQLSLVTLCALLLCTAAALAASFTPGNLVIYRVGDGAGSLTNTGAKVFLDEYTTNGTLVQSIELPSNPSDPNQLVASGTATSEGMITRSTDGMYLLVTGYRPNPFPYTNSLAGTQGTMVNRVIGRVSAAGTLSTMALSDFASANNPRCAVSTDGTEVWMCGGAGGTRYATWGSTNSTQVSTNATNLRCLGIFDGNLYFTSQSTGGGNTLPIGQVGSGLPTSATAVVPVDGLPTNIPGYSFYAFSMHDLSTGEPGLDTLYLVDDGANPLTNGVYKFCKVNGVWQQYGRISTNNYRGLVGVQNGTIVTLYLTTGGSGSSGGGALATVTDNSGYQGTLTGTLTTLATASANTAFRGVALAPIPEPATATLALLAAAFVLRRR